MLIPVVVVRHENQWMSPIPHPLFHIRLFHWQVETVNSMMKRNQGSALAGKTVRSRRQDMLLRVLTHNAMILRSRIETEQIRFPYVLRRAGKACDSVWPVIKAKTRLADPSWVTVPPGNGRTTARREGGGRCRRECAASTMAPS